MGGVVVEAQTESVSIQVDPIIKESDPPVRTDVHPGGQPDPPVRTDVHPGGQSDTDEGIQEELDANRKLLEELSKQVAEFKKKDEQKTEIIEDLTTMVKDNTLPEFESVRGSADEVPTVITTSTVGQFVTTGYRANTHRVTLTPQQALQQNTAKIQGVRQTVLATPQAQQAYDAQLAQVAGTPDSGPKESLLLALTLTFIALLGWKMRKVFT